MAAIVGEAELESEMIVSVVAARAGRLVAKGFVSWFRTYISFQRECLFTFSSLCLVQFMIPFLF